MDELMTRIVPWEQAEFAYARNRALAERPPMPTPGEQVWLRMADWDPAELATVLDVQPLDEREDPNLWEQIRDPHSGRPMYGSDDRLLYAQCPDPWPHLTVRRPDRLKDDGTLMGYGHAVNTRESRVRGSAGWLPLDYLSRPERWRLPAETALLTRPPLLTPDRTGAQT